MRCLESSSHQQQILIFLDLLLNLQYLALGQNDSIKIRELDAAKTLLGEVSSSLSHVPQLMVPANIGALVEIARAPCAKENTDVVVVGHSSYLPGEKL